MAEVKQEEEEKPCSHLEPHIKEEPDFHLKEEPQELPFRIITVKTEPDLDLDQASDDSDTDRSEDYSREQEPNTEPCSREQEPNNVDVPSEPGPFSCSDQAFRTPSDSQPPAPTEKPHRCSVCHKSFSLKFTLKSHMKTHSGDNPLVCSECGKAFILRSNLQRHRCLVHHICPVCPCRFSDRPALNAHLSAHVEAGALDGSSVLVRETLKSLSCPQCRERFRDRGALALHVSAVHRGEKPHRCPLCHKSFTQKGSLNAHARTHSGEKPLVCEVCGRPFAHRGSLNLHLKSHAGEKAFVCSVCSKGFNRKSHLQRHQTQVHQISELSVQ